LAFIFTFISVFILENMANLCDIVKFGAFGIGIVVAGDLVKSSIFYVIYKKDHIYKTVQNNVDKNKALSITCGVMSPICFLGASQTNVSDLWRVFYSSDTRGVFMDYVREAIFNCKLKTSILIVSGLCFGVLSISLCKNSKSSTPEKKEYYNVSAIPSTPVQSTPVQSTPVPSTPVQSNPVPSTPVTQSTPGTPSTPIPSIYPHLPSFTECN
jgi:cell division septation protein DedD